MTRITWIEHPSIEGRIVAVINGTHAAWIQTLDWGGHTDYVVRSYISRLNNVRFESDTAAKDWVEGQIGNIDPDKDQHQAPAGYIRITDLDRVKHLVKIKKLAELAGLNAASIAQKVGRGTELSVTESEAMAKVLIETGVIVERR